MEEMQTTIIERIREIIRNENISVETFAKNTGISKYTLDSMFKKETNPSFDNLNKIISAYTQYSLDWLMKGEGQMLKMPEPVPYGQREREISMVATPRAPYFTTRNGMEYYETANGKFRMRVPLIPVKAYAKYVDECRDAEFVNELEMVEFIVDKIGLGQYFAFELKGDSMDDGTRSSLCDKDIVLARELKKDLWHNKLHNEEYPFWIIVLDNTIVCKQIIEHDVERCEIVCHSLNPSPEYADFRLSLNDVRQLCNIVSRQSNSF